MKNEERPNWTINESKFGLKNVKNEKTPKNGVEK